MSETEPMGQPPTDRETPEPNGEKEKQIEFFMKPLLQVVACETFKYYGDSTSWYVTVEWSEPPADSASDWKKFDAIGPLNDRFIDFARQHYEFWVEKGLVPIKITKIEYLPDASPQRRSW